MNVLWTTLIVVFWMKFGCHIWLQRAGDTELTLLPTDFLTRQRFICGKHFKPECYLPVGKKLLKAGSVPTDFLEDVVSLNEAQVAEYPLTKKSSSAEGPDPYLDVRNSCSLMETGVAALIGPNSPSTAMHIQSVCDYMEMPHIETRWDSRKGRKECSVNLYPAAEAYSKAIYDVIKSFGWTKFTIIYENTDSLQRLSHLIQMYDPKGHPVTLRQLSKDGDYRPVFKQMKKEEVTLYVVDCSIDILEEVLVQAYQVGLIGDGYNYFITNLDWHTLDLQPFKHAGTNLTGIQIVLPEDKLVSDFISNLEEYASQQEIITDITADTLRVETALMYDSTLLLTRALERLDVTQEVDIRPLDCNAAASWEHGCSLANFMKTSEIIGLSGVIRFDTEGVRSDFILNIVELQEDGLNSIALWNISEGVKPIRREEAVDTVPWVGSSNVYSTRLDNVSFIVLISLEAPYGMLKDSFAKLHGNDRYEGYCIDLIHELSLLTGFNYTFVVEKDYGTEQPDGRWNGMMGHISEGRADLAIADLSITRTREDIVDFTMPFMNLGIALLYVKPQPLPPSTFSFLSPFSFEVWGCLFLAFCCVSFELFVQARMAPKEWNNPYPCVEEPEELENQFSLNNSFWFSIGAFLQQGTEIAPIAVSTRMTATMWWFFTLIIVSSYTANLAAFLSVVTYSKSIESVEELPHQDLVKYGTKNGGSTYNFFKSAKNGTIYHDIWMKMDANGPSVFAENNHDGFMRVINGKGKYAFFMESTSIEYQMERHCDLRQVGKQLDSKNYGIALKKNSPNRNVLNAAVLKLQESGKLQDIKRKWWKQKRGGGACVESSQNEQAPALGLQNVGGVFLVLVVGLAVALVVAIFEITCHNFHKARKEKISFKQEMIEDIKFILQCYGSIKEVRKVQSEEDMLCEVLEDFQPVSPDATAVPVQQDQVTPSNHISHRKKRDKSGSPNAETGTGTTSSSDKGV